MVNGDKQPDLSDVALDSMVEAVLNFGDCELLAKLVNLYSVDFFEGQLAVDIAAIRTRLWSICDELNPDFEDQRQLHDSLTAILDPGTGPSMAEDFSIEESLRLRTWALRSRLFEDILAVYPGPLPDTEPELEYEISPSRLTSIVMPNAKYL